MRLYFTNHDVTGLAELSMDDLLFQSSLGRLSGSWPSPNEQFMTCSLASNGLNKDSYRQNDAIVIADLLNSSSNGLDQGCRRIPLPSLLTRRTILKRIVDLLIELLLHPMRFLS